MAEKSPCLYFICLAFVALSTSVPSDKIMRPCNKAAFSCGRWRMRRYLLTKRRKHMSIALCGINHQHLSKYQSNQKTTVVWRVMARVRSRIGKHIRREASHLIIWQYHLPLKVKTNIDLYRPSTVLPKVIAHLWSIMKWASCVTAIHEAQNRAAASPISAVYRAISKKYHHLIFSNENVI